MDDNIQEIISDDLDNYVEEPRAIKEKIVINNEQFSKTFCSKCNTQLRNQDIFRNEIIGDDPITHFICNSCEEDNFFDMEFVNPMRLPIDNNDHIVDKYREIFGA